MPGPLTDLMMKIAEINQTNGWFDAGRPFAADLMLIDTETAEAFEAVRDGFAPDEIRYDKSKAIQGIPKPEGPPTEIIDVIVRALDTCYRYGIDPDYVMAKKLEYNAVRGYRHGGRTV